MNVRLTIVARGLAGLACLAAASPSSGDPAELLARGRTIAATSDYVAAVEVARSAIEEASRLPSSERLVIAYLQNDMGYWQFELRDGAAALESARAALATAEAYLPPDDSRLGYFLRDVGRLAYAAGHCDESISAYDRARALVRSREELADTRAELDFALAEKLRSYGDARAVDLLSSLVESPGVPSEISVGAHIELAMLELERFDVVAAFAHLDAATAFIEDDAQAVRGVRLTAARVWAERAAGRYERAEELLSEAEAQYADLPLSARALLVNERANLEAFRGRFAVAERHYQELLAAYPGFANTSMPMANAYYHLAFALRELGDFVRAEIFFAQAERGLSACPHGDPWRLALLLNERGRLRLELGRVADAEADAAAMQEIIARARFPQPVIHAYALALQSEANARRGRLADARALMTQGLEAIRTARGDTAEDLAPGLVRLAEWSLALGDDNAAQAYASDALALRQRTGAISLWGEATAWSLIAAAAEAGSERYAEAARGLVRSAERYLDFAQGAPELVRQELRASRDIVDRALQPAMSTTDSALIPVDVVATLIQLPQLAESAAVLGDVQAVETDGGSNAQELLHRRSSAIQRRRTLVAQIVAMGSVTGGVEAAIAPDMLREIVAVDNELEANAAALRQLAPRMAERLVPRTLAPAELQRLLHDGEALYMQVVTRTGTHGVLVRADRVVYRSGRPESARDVVRRAVRRLRASLDLQQGAARVAFDVTAARSLYDSSLGPFAADLEGVRELVVVADDAFQSVPWSVFLADSIENETNGGMPPFLATRFSITNMPSTSAFAVLRESSPSARSGQPFLGVGDPVLRGSADGRSARSASSLAAAGMLGPSAEMVRELEPLPQTAQELRAIAASLGGRPEDIMLGPAATRSRLQRMDLASYRVVSFATHGLLVGEFRGLVEPALVLTPEGSDNGLLTASEIATLRLNAELVMLSACNTGRTDDGGGAYGLSALSRAFFAAGAQSLAVSHWAVDSEATVLLLTKFIELATADGRRTKSEALGEAMRWMLSGGAGERYRDPAYWAAFVLIGDSRPLGIGVSPEA